MISIVIPTYNPERERDLFQCLDSISRQTFRDIEIVLIVEQSLRLYKDAKQYLEHFPFRHQIIFSEGIKGISYARNLGVENCHGDIIAFIDDDVILLPHWAENLVITYGRHPDAVGVTGRLIPLWIDEPQDWFPKILHWMIGCTTWRDSEREGETKSVAGGNMSFRTSALKLIGFRQDLGAGASSSGKMGFPNEDNDFAIRITSLTSKPIIYSPEVMALHKVYSYRFSNRYIRRYAFWQGVAEARYSKIYGRDLRVNLRGKVLKWMFRDLCMFDRNWGRRTATILTFLVFASLGMMAYRSNRLLLLSKSLL